MQILSQHYLHYSGKMQHITVLSLLHYLFLRIETLNFEKNINFALL